MSKRPLPPRGRAAIQGSRPLYFVWATRRHPPPATLSGYGFRKLLATADTYEFVGKSSVALTADYVRRHFLNDYIAMWCDGDKPAREERERALRGAPPIWVYAYQVVGCLPDELYGELAYVLPPGAKVGTWARATAYVKGGG